MRAPSQSARFRAIAVLSLVVGALAVGGGGGLVVYLLGLLLPWLILGLPVAVWYRERAEWRAWETLVPLLAFAAWGSALAVLPLTKSMANLIEIPMVGVVLALLTWVRVAAARRVPLDVLRRMSAAAAVLLSVLVALVVPTLPE